MLALRNALCDERWAEVWEVIEREEQRQVVAQRQARRASKQAAATVAMPVEEGPPVADEPAAPAPSPSERVAKARHHWTRPWSIRRPRELAGAA